MNLLNFNFRLQQRQKIAWPVGDSSQSGNLSESMSKTGQQICSQGELQAFRPTSAYCTVMPGVHLQLESPAAGRRRRLPPLRHRLRAAGALPAGGLPPAARDPPLLPRPRCCRSAAGRRRALIRRHPQGHQAAAPAFIHREVFTPPSRQLPDAWRSRALMFTMTCTTTGSCPCQNPSPE